ncbi:hypothetical protein GC194_07570 [bacterium]|nr:hypothetical protein [bacterium]
MTLLLLLLALPLLILSGDFIYFLIKSTRILNEVFATFLDFIVLVLFPVLYYIMLDENQNDCCSVSATFSPDHKLTIYSLIGIAIAAYFYSVFKKGIKSPIVEVITNSALLFGFTFNILVAIHIEKFFWIFGNIPVGILFMQRLIINHRLAISHLESEISETESSHFLEKIAWKILKLKPLSKFTILFLLTLPLLSIIVSLLLLFGQKPDSIIRGFTDTYKHGFSQLDYLCENVECGGHFLCSVAANGHKSVVNTLRYGERNGHKIMCNRQLLIANAFEEIIEQKLPKTHLLIRKTYNRIGNLIHRHYHFFNNKIISDTVYLLMKPLEFIFLLTIYTLDKKPENRIAQQYLSRSDREFIKKSIIEIC